MEIKSFKVLAIVLIAILGTQVLLSNEQAPTIICNLSPVEISIASGVSNGVPFLNTSYGGYAADEGKRVFALDDGSYMVAGTSRSWSAGTPKYWLLKFDSAGNPVWNASYGPATPIYLHSAIRCSDGGYAMFGYSDDGGDFEMFLFRTTSYGDHMWNMTYGGPGDDYGYDLIELDDGGLALLGSYYNGSSSYWDYMLIRTDEDGHQLWNSTFGGYTTDTPYKIVSTDDDGFVMGGYTSSFGAGSNDMWLVKADFSGVHLWNRTFGNTYHNYAYDMTLLSNGGFALIGRTQEAAGMEPADVWLVVTNSTGHHQWNKTYDGIGFTDQGNAIVEMPDGGFSIAASIKLTTGESPSYLWYLRTDSAGNDIWNYTLDSTSSQASDIIKLDEGGVLIVGRTSRDGPWDCVLIGIPELDWVQEPSDKSYFNNEIFSYDIDASSAAGIASWVLDGSTSFDINNQGIVSNATVVSPGDYDLTVTVTDNVGNEISGDFTVTVTEGTDTTTTSPTDTTDTTPGDGEEFPIVFVAGIIGAAMLGVILVVVMIRKGKPE
ncbi:MAG: hypothetical protein ACFE7R_08090 [Candidatus Hodarchaeota archaeon]